MRNSVKHTIKSDKAYFLTLTVVDWIDVFTRKNHRDAIISSIRYCQEYKGLVIFAYVIMTNHIHMIANTNEPFFAKRCDQGFKEIYFEKDIGANTGRTGKQTGMDVVIIYGESQREQKA